MLCFRKFLVAKKFMDQKRGGDYLNFSSNFWSRKSLWKRRGRVEYRYSPSKIFCLKVPKSFVVETFSLSLFSGIEKFYASEGFVTIFRRNFFVSQTEILRRGTLLCCVSENFW